MRISFRAPVGSPTARLAGLAAAALLLASGPVVAGASPGDGQLVVDPNDPSAFQTISDAVAAAVDGDTILVKPGTYAESIAVRSDITIQGDGERGGIVVQFAGDGPSVHEAYAGTEFAYGILVEDSNAVVANLTVSGPSEPSGSAMSGVYFVGGAPIVMDVDIVLPGGRWASSYYRRSAVRVTGGSSATVTGSTWDGYVSINGEPPSAPTFEGNTITGQHIAVSGGGQQPLITGNIFLEGAAIRWDDTGSGGVAEGNDIAGWIGVDEGNDPIVRQNRIRTGGDVNAGRFVGAAIGVAGGATPLVEANEIQGSAIGILVTGEGAAPEIRANAIRDSSDSAIRVDQGTSPVIADNTIEDNAVGITVAEPSTPTLSGNAFCGNEQDLRVPEGSGLTLEGNTVCAT